MDKNVKNYDLEERTARFEENIIGFCKTIKQDVISRSLIDQLVRSGTSVGANYMEANGASSRRDFSNKIFICKKEAQETKHWLRMIAASNPDAKDQMRQLWQEAHELALIFNKITISSRSKLEIKN